MYRYVEQPISNGVLISSGAVPGQTNFRKFGFNGAVSTTPVYIGGIGGAGPYMPSSAVPIRAFSDNSADTSTGTGAREIIVEGLDGNFAEVSVTLSMNATSVTTASTQDLIRTHRSYVSVPGAYRGTNVGAITIETTAGTAFGMISSGQGQTQLTGYCVPAGKTLYVSSVHISVDNNQPISVSFWGAPGANAVSSPFGGAQRLIQQYAGLASPNTWGYDPPLPALAYTDLWMTGAAGAGSGSVSGEYVGILKG